MLGCDAGFNLVSRIALYNQRRDDCHFRPSYRPGFHNAKQLTAQFVRPTGWDTNPPQANDKYYNLPMHARKLKSISLVQHLVKLVKIVQDVASCTIPHPIATAPEMIRRLFVPARIKLTPFAGVCKASRTGAILLKLFIVSSLCTRERRNRVTSSWNHRLFVSRSIMCV